jgi:maltooligosyltrehalose trehalohydrolase
MTEFRVWAPLAQNVQLRLVSKSSTGHSGAGLRPAILGPADSAPEESRSGHVPLEGDTLLEMTPVEGGWWLLNTAEAGPGMDYWYVLDGAQPLPDPRSPWQPQGVHGPSRLSDHSAFEWTDQRWQAPPLSAAVFYELHIGTFTPEGTFDGAAKRLGHLVSLGVTHVELMPVNEFPGDWGWGYDGVDLFAPHHAYGGPEGLKRLVDACHAAGLAVVLDVVYNHLGPSGNYLARFGPYFTSRYSTPWGPALNLDDAGSTEVRRFLCDNALMWLREYHFDGLRLDAIHAILDASAVHFLEQLESEVKALEAHIGRHLVLIAESDLNAPRIVTAPEAGGYGIDAQWSDDFHHALHTVLTGERTGYYADFGSLADLAKALQNGFIYDGQYSAFRNRSHGRTPGNLPGSRFLGFLQNHDQIGNRATGERSSMLMSVGRLKVGAALVLCSPFIPLLFQGEEFGATTPFLYFTNHGDEDLGRAVSEGRRNEFAAFGWKAEDVPDPQAPATFLRSKLGEPENMTQRSLLEWHRRLIALRRAEPDLTDGRLDRVKVQFSEEQGWLTLGRGAMIVVCNLHAERRYVPWPGLSVADVTMLLSSSPECIVEDQAITLPSDSVAILKRGA